MTVKLHKGRILDKKISTKSTIYTLYLLGGVFIYELVNILHTVNSSFFLRGIQLIALIVIIYSFIKLPKSNIENSYFSSLIKIFIIWNLVLVLRMKEISFDELRLILFQPIHLTSYLVPLIVYISINIKVIKSIFKYSIVQCIVLPIVYYIFCINLYPKNNLTDLIITTYIPGTYILLLSWYYQKRFINVLSLIIIIFSLYFGAIQGRRSIVAILILILILGWLIIIFNFKIRNAIKKTTTILLTLIIALIIYNQFNIIDLNKFETLANRMDTDSRSIIIYSFIKDFTGSDWIVGRGVDGMYYNPITYWNFTNEIGKEVVYRENIENGYLYLILKGGGISLCLFLLIIIPSIYLGIFRGKNNLVKVFALYLIVYLVDMVTFGQPALSTKFILVWISIAICINSNIRNMTEHEISKLFKN